MMPFGWHDGGWGITWMIVSWAVIVATVVWVVRSLDRGGSSASSLPDDGRDAERILEGRYARGEISEQEFLERRRVLKGR